MAKRSYDLTNKSLAQGLDFDLVSTTAKIAGGALATESSRDRALSTQMPIAVHGRRVLAQCGLHGQPSFLVVDGVNPVPLVDDAVGTVTQQYPTSISSRVMLRTKSMVTPGYQLHARGIFARSGPCQRQNIEPAGWFESESVAYVMITVSLFNGTDTVSESKALQPKWSSKPYKALTTGAGGAFDDLEELSVSFNPSKVLDSTGWTEHVEATITVYAFGGVRPVDVMVFEAPYKAVHDATHREGTISGFPVPGKASALEYAITGLDFDGGDPRQGSVQANKTMRDMRRILGPRLLDWTSWNEDVAAVTVTEADPLTVTSTTFLDIRGGGINLWAATNPGWSLSSGGTARNLENNGPLELRGKNAVCPVLIRCYAKMGGIGHSATVRFQSASYSLRDFTVSGTSYTWYSGIAWLRCGVHQTDPSVLQIMAKCAGVGQTCSLRYASVEHYSNYEVVE